MLDHLPEHAKPHVRTAMLQAYARDDADKARARLERFARSLDEPHPSAAASLREGLDETLAVLRLGHRHDRRARHRTDAAQVARDDEPIESTFSTVRRVSGRVTRWQSGTMALRWALTGMMEAAKTWRRLMGKADLPKLVTALRQLDLARAVPTARRTA